jgi:AcrR family transcriptional regulator
MTESQTGERAGDRPRKRRSDGERSRAAILHEAVRLATVEGIEGLSISRLADAVGMSKSGLFAHFGSKEELQLATFDTANAMFDEQVIDPTASSPTGVERLRQLSENYLRWVQGPNPGGCFFASVGAEMDTRPGPVRDRIVRFTIEWLGRLEAAVRAAQTEGSIDSADDAAQLAFEIEAHLFLANALFAVSRETAPIEQARRAIEHRLAAAAP